MELKSHPGTNIPLPLFTDWMEFQWTDSSVTISTTTHSLGRLYPEFCLFLLVLEDACGPCFILFGLGQSCSVVPISVGLPALDGMSYNGRSCLKVCLNLLTSFKQAVLTKSDLG